MVCLLTNMKIYKRLLERIESVPNTIILTLGQKNSVNVYRFISKDTIEEEIIERAKRKMVLEYSIIKTMDTSGIGIMQGRKGRSIIAGADITKEELQTILKFGAKNLFKNDEKVNSNEVKKEGDEVQSTNQLEGMNLDDILARAEVHEGPQQSGTALGSEEFLNQFHVSDVAVNEMTWDELIPEHLRDKPENDLDVIPEEYMFEGRRRAASSVNYIGAEIKLTNQKRKRKKNKTTDPDSKLNEKELKYLIRSLLKYGDIERRYDVITADADIGHKNRQIVTQCVSSILSACKKSCKEGITSVAPNDSKGKGKVITSEFEGVAINNSALLLQRVEDLSILAKRLENQPISSFRIPWSSKPILNWSVKWGAKDDSMLLAGIYKHGFGSWENIQDDPDLPFANKFFLNPHEKQLPKASHLVRRGEVLLRMMNDTVNSKVSGKNANIIGKLVPKASEKDANPSSSQSKKKRSPSASEKRHGKRQAKETKGRSDISATESAKIEKPLNVDESSTYESMDEKECKERLRPVKKELKFLLSPPDEMPSKEKAKQIKSNLARVGQYIEYYVMNKLRVGVSKKKTTLHLWKFASYFWPKKISSTQLKDLFTKITSVDQNNKSSSLRSKSIKTQQKPDQIEGAEVQRDEVLTEKKIKEALPANLEKKSVDKAAVKAESISQVIVPPVKKVVESMIINSPNQKLIAVNEDGRDSATQSLK